MSRAQAAWSADGSSIPSIDPHTKAKHQILEEYIKNWIITLAKGKWGVRTVTLIDGFCGGGIYDDPDSKTEWEGSPIRIIKAVQAGLDFVKNQMSKPNYDLDFKFIFIDKKQKHLDCLKNYAMPKSGLEKLAFSDKCEFIAGNFEDLINLCTLKLDCRKGHSFFFLDPFGWTDVSMDSIRKINSLKGSEILYTYMIDFIRRFLTERDRDLRNAFQNFLEADGYYENVNSYSMDKPGEQCYLRNESMRLFRDRGRAQYAFTFSLIPKGDLLVKYYLMHLCNNITALEVMKKTFCEYNNLDYQFHFEVYGTGFKTAEFYEQTPDLQFDITGNVYDLCVKKIEPVIKNLVQHNQEGISLGEISKLSMEFTPASKEYYISHLNQLRIEKELEIIRKDKKTGVFKRTTDKKIRNSDVVKLTKIKQLFLFN